MNKKKQTIILLLTILITAVLTFGITVNYYLPIFALSKGGISQDEIINKLEPLINVIKIVDSRYIDDIDIDKMIVGAIKGAVNSLADPYAAFFTPEEFNDFIVSIQGSFEGIGISVTMDEDGIVRVISPIEDTPGHKAGILPDDRIVQIDDINVKGLSLDEAVNLMRGPKGSKVALHVKREGEKDILIFEIVRAKIELKTVKHSILEDSIGYVKITSFDESTPNEFKTALKAISRKKVKGLVIDLRNNPGGLLKESAEIADELIGENLIVYTEDKAGNKTSVYKSDKNKINVPLVILVNKYSASASEIVAGAVQDTESGVIVGTRTFGKGSVQEPILFNDGSGLKVTTAKYYLPSGRSIHGIGVEPDITVELPEDVNTFDIPIHSDTQLQKGIEILNEQIKKLNQ